MRRRPWLVVSAVLLSTLLFSQTPAARRKATQAAAEEAANKRNSGNWRAIHNSALVIDTHADTPQRFVDEGFDLAQEAGKGHMDFSKIKAGNLGAEFWSIWVEPEQFKGHEAKRSLDLIDAVYEQAYRHPDRMMMAFSTRDILAARSQHKLASLMGVEGGHAIEGDIRILRDFYRLGIRYMTLTWANTNQIGDSSGDVNKPDIAHHNGLTDFGRQVVAEMNRLGMMVDISHVADKTFYDTLEVTQAPVIASHSSARALTNVPRDMTDEMLAALAKNGGVTQVNYSCGFISQRYADAEKRLKDEKDPDYQALMALFVKEHTPENLKAMQEVQARLAAKLPRPPLSDLIDHIDHMVRVAGVDHVGLGSDFDGVDCLPQGIDSVADLPKITEALYQRGYNAQELHKILGGNLMRVFAEVEQVSARLQAESGEPKKSQPTHKKSGAQPHPHAM